MKKDLTRKRNADLNQQLEDLKFKIELKDKLNSESSKKAVKLIEELELLREEFIKTISDLKKSQEKYDELIRQITIIKQSLEKKNK